MGLVATVELILAHVASHLTAVLVAPMAVVVLVALPLAGVLHSTLLPSHALVVLVLAHIASHLTTV